MLNNATGKEMTVEEYKAFMYNPANEGNCEECPENRGFEEGASRIVGPCGQQNCWVYCHCKSCEDG